MKFQSEIELIKILKETIKEIYKKEYVEIFDEVSLGNGIADIVISRLVKPKKKLKPSKFMLNNCDINIYNLIRKYGEISFDTIIDTTRSSKREVTNSLKKLIANKYIIIYGDILHIDKNYELPFHTNFAVEAKLKNWKQALKQAYRYKWFAEYSYVVLDAHHSNTAIKNLESFKKYNVGLASISTEGQLIRYFNPTREQPFDSKMQILFSEKIKNNYEFAR